MKEKIAFANLTKKQKEKLTVKQLTMYFKHRITRIVELETEINILQKMIFEKLEKEHPTLRRE